MRKCPDCAEENTDEMLFCKQCGRCLLSPKPEKLQLFAAVQTDHYQTLESIDVYESAIEPKTKPLQLRRQETKVSTILGWIFVLNLLIIILISGIVIK